MWRRPRSVIVQRRLPAPYSATLMAQKFSGSPLPKLREKA
jgi:hypothetical protein